MRIGDLVVDGLLGEGGMGRVYLCTDHALGRQIAVKTLQPSLLADVTMRERFVREARALAKVKSPHVVTVHAIGDDASIGPYVVMERLVGEDLLQRLQTRGRLPVDVAVGFAKAAAQGLAHAHDAGVLHRDIKPANLFCRRDAQGEQLVITDFGLAKDVGAVPQAPGSSASFVPQAQLTQADVIVGTPAYLAPELARGQAASMSSDLYALGATLFHLLAGDAPYSGDSTIEVITRAVLDPVPRVRSRRPEVPVAVDELVARLMCKRPEERPAHANDVIAVLSTLAPTPSSTTIAPLPPAPTSTQVLGSLSFAEPPAPTSSSNASLSSLVTGAPAPSATDDTVPSLSRKGLAAAVEALASQQQQGPNRKRHIQITAAAIAAVVVGVLVVGLVGDTRRDRIANEAAAVQAEIEALEQKKAKDLVDLGLAHWAQDRRHKAFATWRDAVAAGSTDEVMRNDAFVALEQKDDKGAEALLAAWPEPVESELRALLGAAWSPRHHALDVLEARKTITDDDRQTVALKDIAENDCGARKVGLQTLKKVGKGSAAMSAIKALQSNPVGNLCMALDLKPAEDAVRRRTNKE